MSWKAEVIRACVCGISRLRNDFAALEYSERRVASVPVVELELAPALAAGPETTVVVEDMEKRVSHVPRLTLTGIVAVTLRPNDSITSLLYFRSNTTRQQQGGTFPR